MGFWRTLLNWQSAPREGDEHSIVDAVEFSAPISGSVEDGLPMPIDQLLYEMKNAESGPVTREQALGVASVLKGRNIICSLATLPLRQIDPAQSEVDSPFLRQLDPNVANVVTLSQTVEDLLFHGVAWWRITSRYVTGFPRSVERVATDRVSLQQPDRRVISPLPSGIPPYGTVWVDGRPVPARDMIRFDSPNPPLLEAAAPAIRRARLFEQTSIRYSRNPRPQDYFTPAEDVDPTENEIDKLLRTWREARQHESTAYVPSTVRYNTVDVLSPADLQLIELKRDATLDIANAMGLDPEDLGASMTTRTYQNSVDRRQDRINNTLAPYMDAITDRLSMDDVTPRGHAVLFDLSGYLKANPTERWANYKTAVEIGALSIDEIRREEGRPEIPVEARPVTPAPEPSAAVDEQQEDSDMAASKSATIRRRSLHTGPVVFSADSDEEVTLQFDMDAETANFTVDKGKREVSGLLIPWNKTARTGGMSFSFEPRSLHWSEVKRIKLNREHDRSQTVGVALSLEPTDEGLLGTFRVARGPEGDAVLSLAEDGILDGFSVEVDLTEAVYASDESDVRRVRRGRLTGVAITAQPAFDDARVSRVAASKKGRVMTDQQQSAAPAQHDADGREVDHTNEQMVAAFSGMTEVLDGLKGTLEQMAQGPAYVDPYAPERQRFSVNEEPLYRFDGIGGEHDFSTDLIKGSKGDVEALNRVEAFVRENFSMPTHAEFVQRSDVGALNPTRNRPDLYVDQLDYNTPIWDAIRKGTIADSTPFTLPKFGSASDLVNDHTEGTEPTPGTFTATSQTVTPSAVSGKVEITRETWDQGGSPQLSTILWRQMTRAYYEALESAAAAHLNSLTVTTINLTGEDAELAEQLKAALADLTAIRGGNRFRDLMLASELYAALATATDNNGRPLYPVLGPSNADGQVAPMLGSLNISGLVGTPAWALNEGGNTSSFLFNREDVHGWATTPTRLQFEYRVAYVDVAIWGYNAIATTRTDGVREITYTAPEPEGGGE